MIGRSNKKRISLTVEGMSCSHCEQSVRNALAGVPGITKVINVDKDKSLAEVKVDDPSTVPIDEIQSVLDEAGFKASIPE